MHKPTISILGCGWLGFPLGKALLLQNYFVKGSTTSEEKLYQLELNKILPYLISLDPLININFDPAFFKSDYLALTIPFSRSFSDPKFYIEQIESVLRAMDVSQSTIRKLIFTSSTAIYPETMTNSLESEEIKNFTGRAAVLNEIEQLLISNKNFETVVLRMAGLYGGGRSLGRFLAGKQNVSNGDSPVNLVHLDDCIGIFSRLFDAWPGRNIFNICSDKHPTRRELYTLAAVRMNLPKPSFLSGGLNNKIILNDKIKLFLNYKFIHPDPMLDISDND